MKYTVVWQPLAEQKLAAIWTDASDRKAVTSAANAIDRLLQLDPELKGESRSGSERVLIVPPLTVAFEIREPDRMGRVLSVRYHPRLPP
jgi:plasmid stabilization system protein ParE